MGGRTSRKEQLESVPERRARDEAAGLHEEVPRCRPTAEARLERIGGLPDLDPLGVSAQGVVELVVHEVEVEVGVVHDRVVQTAEQIVVNAAVHQPPVERDDAVARGDRRERDQAGELAHQLVEELDRQDLELHRGFGHDGLVEAMGLGSVDTADLVGVVQLRHAEPRGAKLALRASGPRSP